MAITKGRSAAANAESPQTADAGFDLDSIKKFVQVGKLATELPETLMFGTVDNPAHYSQEELKQAVSDQINAQMGDVSNTAYGANITAQISDLVLSEKFVSDDYTETQFIKDAGQIAAKEFGTHLQGLPEDQRLGAIKELSQSASGLVDAATADRINAAVQVVEGMPPAIQNTAIDAMTNLATTGKFGDAEYMKNDFMPDMVQTASHAVSGYLATIPTDQRFNAIKQTYEGVSSFLPADQKEQVDSFFDKMDQAGPEAQEMLAGIVADDPEFLNSIGNLATTNPVIFKKITDELTSGKEASPETLETGIAILNNPVIRGQLTEMTNNIANDPNITDEHFTALVKASEKFQSVAEESLGSVKGAFKVATGEHEGFNTAKNELAQAYSDMGMSQADFDAAMKQGTIIAMNDKIDGFDNFGSGLSSMFNTSMNSSGAFFSAIGLGGLADTMGIADKGLGDILVAIGVISEEQLASFTEFVTGFLEDFDTADKLVELGVSQNIVDTLGITNDGLNLGIIDKIDMANIDSAPEFITNRLQVDSAIFEKKTDDVTPGKEAPDSFEDFFSPDRTSHAPGVTLSFGDSANVPTIMEPADIALAQSQALRQDSGAQLSFGSA